MLLTVYLLIFRLYTALGSMRAQASAGKGRSLCTEAQHPVRFIIRALVAIGAFGPTQPHPCEDPRDPV